MKYNGRFLYVFLYKYSLTSIWTTYPLSALQGHKAREQELLLLKRLHEFKVNVFLILNIRDWTNCFLLCTRSRTIHEHLKEVLWGSPWGCVMSSVYYNENNLNNFNQHDYDNNMAVVGLVYTDYGYSICSIILTHSHQFRLCWFYLYESERVFCLFVLLMWKCSRSVLMSWKHFISLIDPDIAVNISVL